MAMLLSRKLLVALVSAMMMDVKFPVVVKISGSSSRNCGKLGKGTKPEHGAAGV